MVVRATAPSRPLDAVFDPVYTVSTSGGLPHRSALFRDARQSNSSSRQEYTEITGSERPKFFRRPILPHIEADTPEVMLAPQSGPPTINKHQEEDDQVSRSVGIQTIFRESEAQTDPYTPDYTVKVGENPEISTLGSLHHNEGLPAGQAEIEMIERNRKKRAFEASLPPMTDEASFTLRKKMMEEQEAREWQYREAEIDQLHEQRIKLLQKALIERDKENEFLSEQRIESLRQRLVHEKENAMEKIQQERVTALRKLTKKRQSGCLTSPKKVNKRDIIEEYSDFSSSIYAAPTREGKAGKLHISEVGIEQGQFKKFEMLRDLESSMPTQLLPSSIRRPTERVIHTAKERKQAAIDAHLLKIESIIKKNKEKGDESTPVITTNIGSGTKRRAQVVGRPPTPVYSSTFQLDDELEDAVRLIQKLIRGRAVQNMMFEGKERRSELIQELRACDASQISAVNPDEDEVAVARATVSKAEGEVISELLDFLYKELDRSNEIAKRRKFVELAAEERRRREVTEGGKRQAEGLLRQREDEVFRRIECVNQETASDFVRTVLEDAILEDAHNIALAELNVIRGGFGDLVNEIESSVNTDNVVVRELVASFLLPQVQREVVRNQVIQQEQRFVSSTLTIIQNLARTLSLQEST